MAIGYNQTLPSRPGQNLNATVQPNLGEFGRTIKGALAGQQNNYGLPPTGKAAPSPFTPAPRAQPGDPGYVGPGYGDPGATTGQGINEYEGGQMLPGTTGQQVFNQVNSPGYGPQQNTEADYQQRKLSGNLTAAEMQAMFPNFTGSLTTSRNNPYGSPLVDASGAKGQRYYDDLYQNRAAIRSDLMGQYGTWQNALNSDDRAYDLSVGMSARQAVDSGAWTPPEGWSNRSPQGSAGQPQGQGGVSGMDVLQNQYGPLQQALGAQQRPNVRDNWDGIRQRGGDQRQGPYGGWNERERYGRMR